MSRSGSSLDEWLARLETFSPREIVLGLERVDEVLTRLAPGLPDTVLTVAGTNGKGSSVATAAALMAQTGARIGTYTSPHVLRYNERICVDGQPLPDAAIVDAFERIDSARGTTPLTYFEYGTIAAILAFEAAGVQLAVLEVGMGGRLDAVNAIEPTACLITNISLDHCAWLGSDIETIAVEKAGVMRRGKPAIFADRNMPRAIARIAKERGADLRRAGQDYDWVVHDSGWDWRGRDIELQGLARPSLQGPMQVTNAAGVLALLEAAGLEDLLTNAQVNAALASVVLPGRMQHIEREQNWLLDVAHNPAATEALAATLAEQDFGGRTIALIAMLDDKDVDASIAPLLPHVDTWIAFPADNSRAVPVSTLAQAIANLANRACLEAKDVEQAMAFAQDVCGRDDRILVTGSFYGVGPVLAKLGLYSPR